MMGSEPKPDAWWAPLRRIVDSLLGLVESRMELLAVELQEEKLRVIRLAVWLTAALAAGTIGLLIGLGALAMFVWEKAGYWGLIGLAGGAMACAIGVLLWVRHRIINGPRPFAQTVDEFKKDREFFRRKRDS